MSLSVCAWMVAAAVILGALAAVAAVYAGVAAGVAQEQDRARETSDV